MKISTIALMAGAIALAQLAPSNAQQTAAEDGAQSSREIGAARDGFRRGGPGSGGRMMQPRGGQRRDMMMARRQEGGPLVRMDTNGDEMIDLDEFLAGREERPAGLLERRDADGDGRLSREELAPSERPQRAGIDRAALAACMQQQYPELADVAGIGERFDTLDSNDDTLLDETELVAAGLARAEQQFSRLDANADGLLTRDELRARQADRRELGRELRDCQREAGQATAP